MKKSIWYLLLLLIVISGCESGDKHGYELETDQSIFLAEFKVDSITINMGEFGLFHYPVFSVAEIDSVNYYFGWNNKNKTLDIVDMDVMQLHSSISYDEEGPEGIGEVKGMVVESFDSIFFMSKLKIARVDTTSRILSVWGINERNQFSGFDASRHSLTTEESFNIIYDRKRKKIYTRLHFTQYPWCDSSLDYYKENFIGSLDLVNMSFEQLQMPFPEYFQNENYGFRNIPSVTAGSNDKLNITFSVSSNIYQYDLSTNAVLQVGAKSEYGANHADALEQDDCTDTQASLKHNLLNVKYLSLYHDPYQHLYYRFHWGEVPEQRADGKYSAYNDKKLYLSVLDRGLAKVGEWEVDRRQGASWCFVNNKGLYVLKPRGEEDILGFNLYKFKSQ